MIPPANIYEREATHAVSVLLIVSQIILFGQPVAFYVSYKYTHVLRSVLCIVVILNMHRVCISALSDSVVMDYRLLHITLNFYFEMYV